MDGNLSRMPRTARASVGGICYHVINRSNAGGDLFDTSGDFEAFLTLMIRANTRLTMPILGYCIMPSHFHLVLRPLQDGDLGRWMHWLMTAHVTGYHSFHHTRGRIWQGRFKAFPIQEDAHLLTVLRYVERNPLRAGLVEKAQQWQWSSLSRHAEGIPCGWPIPQPADWLDMVNEPQTLGELEKLRNSVNRGTPFGQSDWSRTTAERLGLEYTTRARGRPQLKK